ncbi:DUF2726 domain-containing protein [Noviherbaspirillum sp. Root189]|uniref:DUF2726 domain-containing protein n=1 Tax=Noviherbaspirillum sp. Root189 TaxID=1736487 RepID=UPI00070BAC4E|nr:DUF2726 domain-containing protein [Noviherbaspirillum sp. Root189]KRB92725.1 hypothetical protein ASE07_15280 [Noviherbaspirillum sp. Root189]
MQELIVFTSIVSLGLAGWLILHSRNMPRFRQKSVLTGGDLEFFYRLRKALPECTVTTQMALSALIEPVGIGKLRKTAMACLEGKRVGYAIFDEDMQLMAVVELDYRARPTRRETAIDACFKSAGVRVVRFHVRRLPSATTIRSTIYERAREAEFSSGIPFHDSVQNSKYSKPKSPWRNTVNAHI